MQKKCILPLMSIMLNQISSGKGQLSMLSKRIPCQAVKDTRTTTAVILSGPPFSLARSTRRFALS